MNRLHRTAVAVTVSGLVAVFGGAVHGVATVEATLEPGTPAAEAAERLEQRHQRIAHADCPRGHERGPAATSES